MIHCCCCPLAHPCSRSQPVSCCCVLHRASPFQGVVCGEDPTRQRTSPTHPLTQVIWAPHSLSTKPGVRWDFLLLLGTKQGPQATCTACWASAGVTAGKPYCCVLCLKGWIFLSPFGTGCPGGSALEPLLQKLSGATHSSNPQLTQWSKPKCSKEEQN